MTLTLSARFYFKCDIRWHAYVRMWWFCEPTVRD